MASGARLLSGHLFRDLVRRLSDHCPAVHRHPHFWSRGKQTMAPISHSLLQQFITGNRVAIISKTTCPFCARVKKLFADINEPVRTIEVNEDPDGKEIHKQVSEQVGKTSVPQVFVKGTHIGGCDDTLAAFESGRLRDLLVDHAYDYDLIVIGGGSGGLAASKEAARFGKKVAMFDFVQPTPTLGTTWGVGGTCVNVGCIPKKLMHSAALLGEAITDAHSYGWRPVRPESDDQTIAETVRHDWPAMVEKVQANIKMSNFKYRVSLREKKVNYINAYAEFVDGHTIRATDKKGEVTTVTSDKFLIATGERPRIPSDCPGAVEYGITSDDLFSLPYGPGKTVVVGASYVALECAGFLNGLGFDVSVLVRSILLRGFDQDIAEKIGSNMEEDGVSLIRPAVPVQVEQLEAGTPGRLLVTYKLLESGELQTIECNTILFAIGRDPCTRTIGLENAGVVINNKTGKVLVNEREETNVPHIYAVGDILQDRLELTPVAIEAGRLLMRRLYGGQERLCDYHNVATTVFTPVEYGCVGYSEEKAIAKFGEDLIEVYHQGFKPYEWGLTPKGVNRCWIKLITLLPEDERVIGFHFLGPNAGEVTQCAALAMQLGVKKEDFDHLIGIHPTSAESLNGLTITKRSGQDPNQVPNCCG